MALEFNKLVDQVTRLGAMVDKLDFDINEKLELARRRYLEMDDLTAVSERIALVRQSDISGYRGGAPITADWAAPVNALFPPPPLPERATVIAVDGSQIYPNPQGTVHFYVINTGTFVYYHGEDRLPTQMTDPRLAFHKDHVHDESKRVIGNRTVDARRTVREMQALADTAWHYHRHENNGNSLIALYDNNLMFWANADVTGADVLLKEYWGALHHLYDVQANGTRVSLAGYVDNPRSAVIMRLLYLMSLADEADIKRNERALAYAGDLEGLRDRQLFALVLKPGERSAIMVQNSPRNLVYRQEGESYEIAFFYIKVGDSKRSAVARVEIPLWVARNRAAVDELHALLLAQCTMQGRNPYPYALTRADELAYISSKDKAKLDEMINIELRRKGIDPALARAKQRGKDLARSDRRSYEINLNLSGDRPF